MEPKVIKGVVSEKTTFSKSIMSTVVFLYFIGAMIGSLLVVFAAARDMELGLPLDSAMFMAYAAYIGGPTATAIGFYAWKSKAENMLKISKSFDKESQVQVLETISNTEVGS